MFALIYAERQRQIEKWGAERHLPDGCDLRAYPMAEYCKVLVDHLAERGEITWAAILMEEVLEAMTETDPENLAKELVQVAAVCCAWTEDIKTRKSHG